MTQTRIPFETRNGIDQDASGTQLRNLLGEILMEPDRIDRLLVKVLTDNDVRITSSSKAELVQQVSDTLLTKMMIDQLQEESNKELQESEILSRQMEQSRLTKERDDQEEQTRLREQQDHDYREAVHLDSLSETVDLPNVDDEVTDQELSSDLSPESLRIARLQYYE